MREGLRPDPSHCGVRFPCRRLLPEAGNESKLRLHAEYNQRDLRVWTAGAHPPRLHRHSCRNGDRMPPVHWGRVGDPIKPSMFDYYAVSKAAAERLVIESGLKYWVSLRQMGIIGRAMAEIEDAIMFHNCFDNVLEYCSDRDSARSMKNLCAFFHDGTLEESFWGDIFTI